MNEQFDEQSTEKTFIPSGNQGQEFGIQPLDKMMEEFNFSNHDLVDAFDGQLSHKNVQKARKGRRLTSLMQFKIVDAINKALVERGHEVQYRRDDLFNYKG